jgi:hypothetical protein
MKRLLAPRGLAAALAILASQGLTLAAFARAGRADGMAAAGGSAVLWMGVLAMALPAAAACLTVSLALAVLSVLSGGPGGLAVGAAGASLAAWDLTRLSSGGAPAADAAGERRLVRSRLLALAGGILPGLVLAGLLGGVRMALPFPVMLGLAVAALLALDRAARRWG